MTEPRAARLSAASPAARVGLFTESVIREMTRLDDEHGAINLAQGFPDFDAPEELQAAAGRAPTVVGLVPADPSEGRPDWELDLERLAAAIGPRTRAFVLTTPHNPTGKVFSAEDLDGIAELAVGHDLMVFTDEIYEHMVY